MKRHLWKKIHINHCNQKQRFAADCLSTNDAPRHTHSHVDFLSTNDAHDVPKMFQIGDLRANKIINLKTNLRALLDKNRVELKYMTNILKVFLFALNDTS